MMAREMNERERYWVVGGGVVAVLLLLIGFVVMPYLDGLERLQGRQNRAERLLTTLNEVRPEVARLRTSLGSRGRDDASGSLTSLMESTAARFALRERLVSLRPQPVVAAGEVSESLEVEVEKVQLEELVRWLYAIGEAPGGQLVSQLRLRKRFDDRQLFDATMVLVRYRVVER